MQAQIADLHSRMTTQPTMQQTLQQQPLNPYTQQPIEPGSVDEQIHRAVSLALQAKEQQERQAQQAQQAMLVQQEYQNLHHRLDAASDKYDDFDDVVRGENAKFTDVMRDTALVLPNAEDVLYKLGKNPAELERISKLPPIQQARELVTLSHALTAGGMGKGTNGAQTKVMGEIKGTPSSSVEINGKTPVSVLRDKLKSGWR